jgi:hypothetical protein
MSSSDSDVDRYVISITLLNSISKIQEEPKSLYQELLLNTEIFFRTAAYSRHVVPSEMF